MVRRLSAALIPLTVVFLQLTVNALAAQLQDASVVAPAGASCALHPQGDTAPEHSIATYVDADGVARFQAARATQPGAIAALALDCKGPNGQTQTITVDLRSDSTFAPRPFDVAHAGLSVRPALTGDPQSYSVGDLIRQGYGLRPDPKANPDGYARWLAGVQTQYHSLRSVSRGPVTRGPSSSRAPTRSATITSTASDIPWTGAILYGSYQENATAALTKSYLVNEATFNVPPITPGLYNTGTAEMSIWNGLDNQTGNLLTLLQAIVWMQTTSTHAVYSINRQGFGAVTSTSPQVNGVTFTPSANDSVYAQEWYCDASGNPNLAGGYACTHMRDDTQHLVWDCSQASSTNCPSFQMKPSLLTNGALGRQAEFVIENDTDEEVLNLNDWPPFATVTMSGSAQAVQGSGTGSILSPSASGETWVTAISDSSVRLAPDWTNSRSFVGVSLTGTSSVLWADGPAKCQGGAFAPGGNVSCSRCPAGTFSAAGAAACSACSPGTYSAGGAAVCSACSAGSYASTSGAAVCSACSDGTYSSATGATACTSCPAGSSSLGGAKGCLSCGSTPANLATTDNLFCGGPIIPDVACVAGAISFKPVGPETCPVNTVAKATSNTWSCSTPTIPSCSQTCTASYTCVSVPPCTLAEAAAGKCTMPNPTCGHPGQKPCPPLQ